MNVCKIEVRIRHATSPSERINGISYSLLSSLIVFFLIVICQVVVHVYSLGAFEYDHHLSHIYKSVVFSLLSFFLFPSFASREKTNTREKESTEKEI